ncbi:MAG: hypothetical protein PGN07_05585 [Aeromicrobium erythreum]
MTKKQRETRLWIVFSVAVLLNIVGFSTGALWLFVVRAAVGALLAVLLVHHLLASRKENRRS